MPQSGETRAQPPQPNIQDAFLNQARRDRASVQIHLMEGTRIEGRIKNFDRFAVIVEHDGSDLLIFKHAIATIRSAHAVANYLSQHQP
jgi:host factor-I protein